MEQDSRKIIAKLKCDGFELVKVKGSHHKFKKNGQVIIVPHPKKDLPIGTARSIAQQAGWLKKGKEE
ncbi:MULTISPECIES: type II toxin-antitoxin system HicA family toxin [Bartonella]|uniref:YcfA family protein n=3 Tax=Bartonella schoenbuchensis TaxID=165694 RepID=N6UCZ1_9HYPH|nr:MULTISPECIES: type II toxin-antitoxin system HicA family toxin [Bartonella]CDP79691.1 YcfA family protein [Bartonella schoenbuchensis]AQX19907.1 putative RNA binding protein YcfA, dsRBD-like fold, HicA-like mRNA interferase family [Bartonella sp. WD16.2]AQX30810.1 putative RNA binding protein YcfA, dsRBD-like fold, HicA-like mRNA interferase family [Bartonella schoenbuchensis R1]AQX31551.1 putative RNA binding protein YcfA, dsRBD-like fold, HicA-like mRNA interferase family [Bartonella schoe